MRYVVAIEKGDKKHAYGVVVPDLPGCFSAGYTLDEALTHAKEAILLHLEGVMDEKKPAPVSIQHIEKRWLPIPDKSGHWSVSLSLP
jgi:predicted RNase H-like HicB family nuclease